MSRSNPSDAQSVPFDCFTLECGALRRGDVILTATPGNTTSALIRAATASRYSHAILVVEFPYGIESSDYGVTRLRLDRCAVRSRENISVRRLREDLLGAVDMQRLCDYASSLVTREYADYDVLTALFDSVPPFEVGKYFCSQLVAEAYERGGLSLFPGKSPSKISPAMLAGCEHFISVTEALTFREAGELPYPPPVLDGSNQPTFVELDGQLKQEVVRSIQPEFGKYTDELLDLNSAYLFLVRAWDEGEPFVAHLDRVFAGAIKASGLIGLTARVIPADSEQFFVDLMLSQAIKSGQYTQDHLIDLTVLAKEEHALLSKENRLREGIVASFRRDYLQTGLETVRLLFACCWEFTLIAQRQETALTSAIELLEASMGMTPTIPSEGGIRDLTILNKKP